MNGKRKAYIAAFAASLFGLAAAVVYVSFIKESSFSRAETPVVFEEEREGPSIYGGTSDEASLPPEETPEAESTASDFSGSKILGAAPKQKDIFAALAEAEANRHSRPITLNSPVVSVAEEEGDDYSGLLEVAPEAQSEPGSSMTMLTAPVGYRIISSAADYEKFKKTAKGNYPKIDFNKQSFLVLDSKSNLPDNIFEIDGLKTDGGKNIVEFRVNILGLKFRPRSHAFLTVDKKVKSVDLIQVF